MSVEPVIVPAAELAPEVKGVRTRGRCKVELHAAVVREVGVGDRGVFLSFMPATVTLTLAVPVSVDCSRDACAIMEGAAELARTRWRV